MKHEESLLAVLSRPLPVDDLRGVAHPRRRCAATAAISSSGVRSTVTITVSMGTSTARARAADRVTRRGEPEDRTKPTASAPASTAAATSPTRRRPHTFTQVMVGTCPSSRSLDRRSVSEAHCSPGNVDKRSEIYPEHRPNVHMQQDRYSPPEWVDECRGPTTTGNGAGCAPNRRCEREPMESCVGVRSFKGQVFASSRGAALGVT